MLWSISRSGRVNSRGWQAPRREARQSEREVKGGTCIKGLKQGGDKMAETIGARTLLDDLSDPYTIHLTRPSVMLTGVFVTGFVVGLLGFLATMFAVEYGKFYADRASKTAFGLNRKLQSQQAQAAERNHNRQRRPSMSERVGQVLKDNLFPILPRQGSKLLAALL